jgi:hypothetical protein
MMLALRQFAQLLRVAGTPSPKTLMTFLLVLQLAQSVSPIDACAALAVRARASARHLRSSPYSSLISYCHTRGCSDIQMRNSLRCSSRRREASPKVIWRNFFLACTPKR